MRPLDDTRDPALPDHAEPADAGSPRPAPAEPPAATPVMAQYWALKEAHPGCLLFFRMGDFYELFFEDAVAAAAALDIALTKRGRHLGEDIPMCGVPAASHEGYLARLIRRGFKVAVCEQLEAPADARKRGAKAVVARDVVRIVTPGTLTEETLLEARRPNHLAALAAAGDRFGLTWVDISTGRPGTQVLRAAALPAALARIEPGELLVPDHLADRPPLKSALADWQARLTLLPAARFERRSGERRLGQLYGVATLAAFGDFDRVEIAALGALIDYVLLTQKGKLPRLAPPVRLTDARILQIDAASRRNLELMAGADGGRAGSLLATIDRTVTGMGARCLAGRLAAPLTDPAAIERRLAAVAWFFDDPPLRRRLRVLLKECPDIERALSRLAVGRGGPRDLAQIRDGLACSEALAAALATPDGVAAMPPALAESGPRLADPAGDGGGLRATLAAALAEALPAAVRDGGLIAAGHDAALDALRLLRDDSRRLILELEARYVAETGLGQLRIRHNALLGYYVEVPQRLAERVPAAPAGPFIQRQSMANAVRYQTVDLADLERRIARAADEMIAREAALFQEMADRVLAAAPAIAAAARAIARVDVAAGLAELAETARYVRPSVDRGGEIVICGGRHPVVEARLGDEAAAGRFVANDCRLGEEHRLWLLTGPNMAGKSTFLRQTALIILLAQVGSFVPADTARIGVVDRLFSRVGAADDLARGRSTFMVEMVETATILAEAGPASFVILDEVGRGTATFDGLAIAWAVVEHLAEHSRCRGLIATHYHELTALAARLPALGCYTMRTKEWRGDVVFLHEVTAGAADRSYGVHVARLAGLPRQVIGRAEAILRMLERSEPTSALTRLAADLPLFAAALARPAEAAVPPPAAPPAPSPVEARLREIDPDTLTPRQALDLLYDLKADLDGAP